MKIVSPAAYKNPDLGTEFPRWNRGAAVVECRACALSVAGKPEFGRGSYHQSIWPFCARLAKAARLTAAVRAASAISALRPIATKLVRRNELTRRADRVLTSRYSTTSSAAACSVNRPVKPTACAVPLHRYAPEQFPARSQFNVLR